MSSRTSKSRTPKPDEAAPSSSGLGRSIAVVAAVAVLFIGRWVYVERLQDPGSLLRVAGARITNPAGIEYCRQWLLAENPRGAVMPTDPWFMFSAEVNSPQFNIPSLLPAMVMRPSTTKDVQLGLQCATAQNLSVAVRNGGHSYAGYSQNPGAVVMNVRALNSIQLVNYTIQPLGRVVPALRLGGGVIFGEILNFLNGSCGGACMDTDYLIAGGLCPTVGAAAFHAGGGLGASCRMYGMGSDNVLEYTVVSTNGSKIWVANNNSETDLFWALRGGGGPSFGVITELVVQIHPVTDPFSYGEYCVSGNASMAASLSQLAQVTADPATDFPAWLTVHWRLIKSSNIDATGLCYLIYSLRGRDETIQALSSFLPDASSMAMFKLQSAIQMRQRAQIQQQLLKPLNISPPHQNFLEEYKYFKDWELANAIVKGYPPVGDNYEDVATAPSLTHTCVLPGLNNRMITALLALYYQMPSTCAMQGMALGGPVISSIAPDATAFPWRQRVLYAADSGCGPDDASLFKQSEWFLNEYNRTMTEGGWCLGSYYNFPDADLPANQYAQMYWQGNVARLSKIRAVYNPLRNNPLAFQQEVPLPY